MKNQKIVIAALAMATAISLTACGGDNNVATVPSSSPIVSSPAPVESEPVKSEPVKSEPVESEPVESKPVESEPVESEPVESEPVESEPVESEPVESEPVESKPVESKPVESKPVESKPATIKTTTETHLDGRLTVTTYPLDLSTCTLKGDVVVNADGTITAVGTLTKSNGVGNSMNQIIVPTNGADILTLTVGVLEGQFGCVSVQDPSSEFSHIVTADSTGETVEAAVGGCEYVIIELPEYLGEAANILSITMTDIVDHTEIPADALVVTAPGGNVEFSGGTDCRWLHNGSGAGLDGGWGTGYNKTTGTIVIHSPSRNCTSMLTIPTQGYTKVTIVGKAIEGDYKYPRGADADGYVCKTIDCSDRDLMTSTYGMIYTTYYLHN